MTTFNTGNPIGSTDARDLSDNAENFDTALGTTAATWIDRLGVTRDSFEGRLAKGSFYRVGTFSAGYTLTNMRQTLEYGGHEYSWAGTFPKVVAAGKTPATSGGIGAGAWVDRTDVTLRAELNVLIKTFSSVSELVSDESLQVGNIAKTLGYFSGRPHGGNTYEIVPAGSGSVDGGSYISLANGMLAKGLFCNQASVYPHQFGCNADETVGDGPKLQSALTYAKSVNKPVDLMGGNYDVGGESFVVTYHHTAIISTGQVASLKFTSSPSAGFGVQILGEYPRSNIMAYTQRHLSNKKVLQNIRIAGVVGYPGFDAVGLKIGDGLLVSSVFDVDNIFIEGFRWFSEFTDNSWGFALNRIQTKHGGLLTPSSPEDYGENITIFEPFFADTYGEALNFNRGEYTIIGGSINNTKIITRNDTTVSWLRGHLENPGGPSTTRRHVECYDESVFYAPGLAIVMNQPAGGGNITEHWFYCEDGNPNGITITGCQYVQNGFYRPDLGSCQYISLVAGFGRVTCDHANIGAISNYVYTPVAKNMRNAMANGDFEAGNQIGWSHTGSATFYTDDTIYKSASRSLKIVSSPTNNGAAKNRINCSWGDRVVGSCWIKADLTNGGYLQVNFRFYDANGLLLSTTQAINKTSTFDWEVARLGGVAPNGASYAEIELVLNFTGASGTVSGWFDGIIVNVL